MTKPAALAIFAHPDDLEFVGAGTLLLLREAGWDIHFLTVSTGSAGSAEHRPAALRRIRRRENEASARLLGATLHPSLCDDIEILYTLPLLRRLTAVVRAVRPALVLTHAPEDYMEDHTETCRLAVTAVFARGIRNFAAPGRAAAVGSDCAVYHALPHGLQDPLRRRVVPGAFVDTTSVIETKRAALACHASQHAWLRSTQGMNSYLHSMETMSRAVGRMSRRFAHAEGWWRHAHLGFTAAPDADPLRAALGRRYRLNPAFERLCRP